MNRSSFIQQIIESAKVKQGRIVLPEGSDERVLEAANTINQEKIAAAMKRNPKTSAGRLAKELGISIRKTEVNIRKLREKGVIKRIGSPRGGYWVVRN